MSKDKISIDDIFVPDVDGGDDINDLAVQEESFFDKPHAQASKDFFKLMVVNFSQNIDSRKKFGNKIFNLLVCWLIVLTIIIIVVGLGWLDISDTTLNFLITTTTVDILGLFFLVVRYLFGDNDKVKEFLNYIYKENNPNL